MALLDTRDAEVCLWQDGEALCSPGVVLLEKGEYRFGREALSQARLRPRDSSNRFWWQLSTQPLKPALGAARHSADLVHSHLRQLHAEAGRPAELTLAVSDSMPQEQLSLLLGIAGACEFRTAGLVSRAVLLGSAAAVEGACLHLELQLHQAVLNELGDEGGEVSLQRSTTLPGCGLLALQERALGAIASAFIQQTRFDPRRRAQSEQSLYNQLPAILADLAGQGECSIEIDSNRCRLSAAALGTVIEPLTRALQQQASDDRPLLVDRQLALLAVGGALPGRLVTLDDDSLWRAYLEQQTHIHCSDDALHLVDRLPRLTGSNAAPPAEETGTPSAAPAPRRETAARATHVLIDTRALPLRGDRVSVGGGFELRLAAGQWTLHGDGGLINGLPSSPRQPLTLGDTLFLGGAGHGRLIEVVD